MLTAGDERPQARGLAPVVGRKNSGTQRNAAHLSMDRSTMQQNSRPSALAAVDDQRSVSMKKMTTSHIPGASKTAGHLGSSKNHQLGRLPTLGLSKYQANDFGDETRNPYYVQPVTEKMLVVRELEREVKNLNKFEKDALRVHQKNIATRQDRTGAIRDVACIPAKKYDAAQKKKDEKKQQQLALQDEDRDAGNKQKLNIFDAQDSAMLKHEQLARIGHDAQMVPHSETSSQISRTSSHNSVRLKPIEYQNKPRQQKESAREFILNSRKILMAQISIADKTEETELLKEYIIMEKEKLNDGKKAFDEDKEKYEKYKIDLATKSAETEGHVRDVSKKCDELMAQINQLKK